MDFDWRMSPQPFPLLFFLHMIYSRLDDIPEDVQFIEESSLNVFGGRENEVIGWHSQRLRWDGGSEGVLKAKNKYEKDDDLKLHLGRW